ncbi:MAG: aspartate aminotransferase family protein [Haloferacaceae archaeon]
MDSQSTLERSAAIPHWSDGGDVPELVEGDGARVTDADGTEYLDFISQLYCVNAGYGNEEIADAIGTQAERLAYVSPSKHNDVRTAFANRLADVAPGDLSDVLFAISGSEANESAIQIAREYTGANKVLTRWRSYHGSTYGAAALTGDPQTRSVVERHAAVTGVTKFLPPMVHNSPFDGDTPEEIAQQAADHLEFVIRNEGPDSVAAVLTEPVAGTSGAYPAPPGYFERVREICDEYDVLLISDEVITGFGRCGEWFGIETEGVEPDMITFAKAATSGYVPLAGVISRPEIGEHLREQGVDVGQTFAGHPVGCAAGMAAFDAYEDGLVENVRELAPTLQSALEELEAEHDVVADVHGRGFHWGVEFADPETGEFFVDPRVDPDADNPVSEVADEAMDRGVIVGTGRPAAMLILSPPLLVDEDDVNEAVSAIDEAIEAVFD